MHNQTKTLEYYMRLPYRTFVRQDVCDNKLCFVAYNPELEGCMAQGDTWQQALANLKDARSEYIEQLIAMEWEIPVPDISFDEPIHISPVQWEASIRRPNDEADLQSCTPVLA